MPPIDIASLTAQVLWAGFILSFVFGAIAQRTHFCTMGAISDVVNIGDWTRMRQWGLAMGVAMLGFAALVAVGSIDPSKTLYAGNRWIWLSAIVGGAMFGFGMVLASGCGSKTLVRIGSGNLKSFVVFLVMGLAAFATLKGLTGVVRVATVDKVAVEFAQPATLPFWLSSASGWSVGMAGLVLAVVIGGGLVIWSLLGRDFRNFDNLLAGLGIGGVIAAMWWVSGHLGFVAEHPETLEQVYLGTNSGKIEALSFTAPMGYVIDWVLFFSDKTKVLTLAIVTVFGVVAGSFAYSLTSRTFRWEGFGGTEDVANHLAGGALMGIGGVTAMGCTVGQGLSGVSTLSATSIVAVAAIVGGAVLAFKYQMWRLERMA